MSSPSSPSPSTSPVHASSSRGGLLGCVMPPIKPPPPEGCYLGASISNSQFPARRLTKKNPEKSETQNSKLVQPSSSNVNPKCHITLASNCHTTQILPYHKPPNPKSSASCHHHIQFPLSPNHPTLNISPLLLSHHADVIHAPAKILADLLPSFPLAPQSSSCVFFSSFDFPSDHVDPCLPTLPHPLPYHLPELPHLPHSTCHITILPSATLPTTCLILPTTTVSLTIIEAISFFSPLHHLPEVPHAIATANCHQIAAKLPGLPHPIATANCR